MDRWLPTGHDDEDGGDLLPFKYYNRNTTATTTGTPRQLQPERESTMAMAIAS